MGYECMLVETASSNTWCDCMEDSLLGGETACAVSLCNNLEAVSRAIERSIISVGDEKEGSKCIIIDFKTALREAVSLLTGAGYESILHLRSINDSPGVVRVEAFNDACSKTGISHGLISATGHIENDVLLLYSNKERIGKKTALLLGDDLYAKDTYRFAGENGLAVGKDIGLISLNNTYICDCFSPHLSSFGFDIERLVSAIMEMIEKGESGRTVVLGMRLNDNRSF